MAEAAKDYLSSEGYREAKRLYMEWYTLGQIAKLLKRSRHTVISWSRRNKWKAERKGEPKKPPRLEPRAGLAGSNDYWEAKRLYIEWLSYGRICEGIERSRNTIMSWGRRNDWKTERTEIAKKLYSSEQLKELPGSKEYMEAKRLYMEWYTLGQVAKALRQAKETIELWSGLYKWKAERAELEKALPGSEDYWEAKRLYMQWYTHGQIRRKLGQAMDTILSWSRRFGWMAERNEKGRGKPPWRALMQLRSAEAAPVREQRIYLVTGRSRMNQVLDAMALIIEYRLGMDPYNGDRYVFCGTSYTTIKGIEWRGGGFVVEMRKAPRGRFPWPRTEEKMVEISAEEYRQLMSWEN